MTNSPNLTFTPDISKDNKRRLSSPYSPSYERDIKRYISDWTSPSLPSIMSSEQNTHIISPQLPPQGFFPMVPGYPPHAAAATFTLSESDIDRIASAVKDKMMLELNAFLDHKIEPLKEEIKSLKYENNELRLWCDSLEQHSRKSCIRLNGIPEEPGEVTAEVVLKVADDIKVDMKPEDIDIAHRLGPTTDKDGRPIHRQIIARLRNHDVRRNMLKNSKVCETIPTRKGVSIRQDLTSMRNGIAYEARQLYNKGKIQGTWITDGIMYKYECMQNN